MKNKKNRLGFTLVELLMVIAIIGILSAVVIANISSTKAKSRRAAVQALLRSVMPELLTCADDGGIGPTVALTSSLYVCASASNGLTQFNASHFIKWPVLPTDWSYGTPSGALASNNYIYSATGNSITVSCSQSTNACQ